MRIFTFDNVAVTLATCIAVGLFYIVPSNVEFLNPITQAIGDFDLTDMVFSKFRSDEDIAVDTSIVIVNIGDKSRAEIAMMVERIEAHQPKVIGIDAFFRSLKPENPSADSALASALSKVKHLVLASKVAYRFHDDEEPDEDTPFDTLETSHETFSIRASTGFTNLVIDEETSFMTVRDASLTEQCADTVEPSFPLRIAEIVSPEKAQTARARQNSTEVISFRGGLEKFYSLDADEVLDPEADIGVVHGKIVLLGYMGPRIGERSFIDNFFTPLNEHYAGRSYPDMFGVVVHANVISMILHEDYINTMPFWVSLVVAFSFLICTVIVFTHVYTIAEPWYDMFALSTQLLLSIAFLYLTVMVFDWWSYKLALTPAIACMALVGMVHDLYQDSLKKLITIAIDRFRKRNASLQTTGRTHATDSEDL